MIVIPLGLFCCYLFLRGIGEKNNRNFAWLILFTGVVTGITMLFKQNFGLALLLNNLLVFFFIQDYRNMRSVMIHGAGFAVVWLLQGVYLLATGSLAIFLQEMYYFMFVKILQQGMLASPYPWEYPSSLIYQGAKIGFYLAPLLLAVGTLILTIRKKSVLFLFATLSILYYVLSIRPTTDYIHLTPLIAMTSISFFVLYSLFEKRVYKTVLSIAVVALLLFGFYSSLAMQYYRWEKPLITNTSLLSNPKAGIYTDPETLGIANKVTNYINKNTGQGETLFIYGLSPMYYFLTERQNPTRYDYVHTGVQTDTSVYEIVKTLSEQPQILVLSDARPVAKNSKIDAYILKNYELVYQVDKYHFFKRR